MSETLHNISGRDLQKTRIGREETSEIVGDGEFDFEFCQVWKRHITQHRGNSVHIEFSLNLWERRGGFVKLKSCKVGESDQKRR